MKKICLIVGCLVLLGVCLYGGWQKYGVKAVPVGTVITRIEVKEDSTDGAKAHLSGNAFETEVGKALKDNYPAKVDRPVVKLVVKREGKNTRFYFTWTCNIVRCEKKDAQKYFGRRGTLKPGATKLKARQNVEAEMYNSQKVPELVRGFHKAYKSWPDAYMDSSADNIPNGSWWYVTEFFCVSK